MTNDKVAEHRTVESMLSLIARLWCILELFLLGVREGGWKHHTKVKYNHVFG